LVGSFSLFAHWRWWIDPFESIVLHIAVATAGHSESKAHITHYNCWWEASLKARNFTLQLLALWK